MQAQFQLITSTRQKLITAAVVAFLAAAAMVPATQATSIVPEDESATEEASARSSVSNVDVTRDQIQFYEDNWYFNVADEDSSDNPSSTEPSLDSDDRADQIDDLRSQNLNEFEAMERAPGLYTEPTEAASPTGEDSVDAGLAHDEMRFLEDNWYFDVTDDDAGDNPAAVEPDTDDQADENRPQSVEEFEAMERAPGLYTEAPDAGSPAPSNPALSREDIQFAEDNWHLGLGVFEDQDEAGLDSSNPALSREDIQFAEDNWNFNSGAALSEEDDADETESAPSAANDTDRADTLDELRNGADDDDADRSHDELTYPWGGYLENDY